MSKNKKNPLDLTWTFGPVPHNELHNAEVKCCMCGYDVVYWTNAFFSPKDDKGNRTYCHNHCYNDNMGPFEPEVSDPSVRPVPRKLCQTAADVVNAFSDYMLLEKEELDKDSPLYKMWETVLNLDNAAEKFRAQYLAYEKRGHVNIRKYNRKKHSHSSKSKTKKKTHKASYECPETGTKLCDRNVCEDHANILVHYAQTGYMGQEIRA